MELSFANLLAVPSFHYDPFFASAVRDAFERFEPTVVALELPAELEAELAWALECWPVPVASEARGLFTPFVPGDATFEAYRLARARSIPVELVDRRARHIEREARAFPGPECARAGAAYLDAVAALDALHPVAAEDAAREAFMAARLARLMGAHERVLWVGGLAHWPRLLARLVEGAGEPVFERATAPRFRRVRLGASVLERACHRWPYLVERYARDPAAYDEESAHRALALDAGATPLDVAKVLLYARNQAMARALGDRPCLAELVLAASAVIDDEYAARLYALAMGEPTSKATARLPSLEHVVTYRLDERPTRLRPRVLLAERPRPVVPLAIRYQQVPPARDGEPTRWLCHPPDEEAYASFVRYLLSRASRGASEQAPSVPFASGLRGGLDARATARDWLNERVFVRETQPRPRPMTNGLIDFAGQVENAPMPGGWADPSFVEIGSASRHCHSEVLQERPFHVNRMFRELAFITLDAPTREPHPGARSFYDAVILPLVQQRGGDLYDWLEVMFAFCANKPFAYFSRYTPSARVHRVAAAYGVRVLHVPLQSVPAQLVERNRSFRFLALTRAQWEALRRADQVPS